MPLSGFGFRQPITITGSAYVGADVQVPVAVHIPSTNTDFWTNEDGQGGYVRFTAADGNTLLPFEVESYDAVGDDAWFHVLVTVSSAADTTIYLYYGATTPSDGENVAGVWDADFLAVYHLNEDRPGGYLIDSISGAAMTPLGTPDPTVAVAVDKGVRLVKAEGDYLEKADPWFAGQQFTVECSVQMDVAQAQGFVTRYDSSSAWEWMLRTDSAGKAEFWVNNGGGTYKAGQTSLVTGQLYHMVGVCDAVTAKMFLDGAPSGAAPAVSGSITDSTVPFRIGAYLGRVMSGLIDEVTISTVVRSTDWIAARNQSRLGAWLGFGAQEAVGSSTTTITVPLSGQYAVVSSPAPITKSLTYAIPAAVTNLQRSAQYAVTGPASATKSLTYGVMTIAAALTRSLQYVISGEVGTIGATEPVERRVYQRVGGAYDLALSGTYTGGPASIEARVVLHGTSTEVVPWTVVDAAPAAGAWSGTLTVPQGGWYNIQARFSNQTTTTYNGVNRWGVGILVGCIGQSNMSRWFESGHGTLTADDLVSQHWKDGGWYWWIKQPNYSNGAVAFGNKLVSVTGLPVGLLNYAWSGSGLLQASVGAGQYWQDTSAGSLYDTFITAVTGALVGQSGADVSVGGDIEFVLWAQGERTARTLGIAPGSKYQTYLDGLGVFFDGQLRTDIKPDLKIIVSLLGRGIQTGTTTPDQPLDFQAVRDAQVEKARTDPLAHVGCTTEDFLIQFEPALTDTIHYTDAEYIRHGERLAATCLYLMGEAGYHRGPQPVSYTISGTTVDVRLRHRGTVDIVPSPGATYTGWEVLDDGAPVTVTNAARLDHRTIRLTLASAPVGVVTVRHLYGNAPDITNVAIEAGTLALPVENHGDIPAARTLSLTLVDRAGAARANLTGLRWALFDLSLPDTFAHPIHQGSGETTDASGVFSVQVPEADVPAGGDAWLVISDSDGTAGQNPTSIAFSAPVSL